MARNGKQSAYRTWTDRSTPAQVSATAEASSAPSQSMASEIPPTTPPPGMESSSAPSATTRPTAPGLSRDAAYHLGSADTPLPDYPWSARRRGREGRVVIVLDVDAGGHPIHVSVVESSGDDALDQAALNALARWRLAPALKDGVPVASQVRVPIRFRLDDGLDLAGT